MGVAMYGGKESIPVIKRKWTDEEVVRIIKGRHSWMGGKIPPKSFEILGSRDSYVPYIVTGVKYYQKIGGPRRCYVLENLEMGLKSGVIGIENLEFVAEETPEELPPVMIDEERHAADIAHYCNLELLVKNYRKFINWTIDILEVRVIYRKKRVIDYMVNGKKKTKDIFLDGVVLK